MIWVNNFIQCAIVAVITPHMKVLRGQVLQRGNSSVLCQVYLLIQWQHMGHQIARVCHFNTATKRGTTCRKGWFRYCNNKLKTEVSICLTDIVTDAKLGINIVGNVIPILPQVLCIRLQKESMFGRELMMKFTVSCKLQLFKGIVNAYDGLTGKYSVYFPCAWQANSILYTGRWQRH